MVRTRKNISDTLQRTLIECWVSSSRERHGMNQSADQDSKEKGFVVETDPKTTESMNKNDEILAEKEAANFSKGETPIVDSELGGDFIGVDEILVKDAANFSKGEAPVVDSELGCDFIGDDGIFVPDSKEKDFVVETDLKTTESMNKNDEILVEDAANFSKGEAPVADSEFGGDFIVKDSKEKVFVVETGPKTNESTNKNDEILAEDAVNFSKGEAPVVESELGGDFISVDEILVKDAANFSKEEAPVMDSELGGDFIGDAEILIKERAKRQKREHLEKQKN